MNNFIIEKGKTFILKNSRFSEVSRHHILSAYRRIVYILHRWDSSFDSRNTDAIVEEAKKPIGTLFIGKGINLINKNNNWYYDEILVTELNCIEHSYEVVSFMHVQTKLSMYEIYLVIVKDKKHEEENKSTKQNCKKRTN